jgi:hypothetical protein
MIETKDFDSLQLPSKEYGISFLLLGSTRSGKTTLMNYIYDGLFQKHVTVLHTFSPQSHLYSNLKKNAAVVPFYAPMLLKESYKINKYTDNHYQFLHIIDDVVDAKNDKQLKLLLTIYRNSRISSIITGQELSIFNAISRSNINYVCLGRLNSDMAIEKVIKSYLLSYLPSDMNMVEKIKYYREMTEGHYFICIDNIHGHIFRFKIDA